MAEKIKRTELQWVRILAQKELPAITSVASMLDKYSNDDISSIPYLSKAILHDQGLSSCLLKVANSSQRASVSKVTTVSRAAIVLGIRAVKNICMTSKILEGLLESKNLAPAVHHRLTMLMANAFYAGLLAKMMVPDHSDDTQEEVYLAAMLYHIGETSFWSTPNDIANLLIKEVHLSPKKFQKKCQQLLGFKFAGLSMGLANTWNLGELLIKSLDQPESRTTEMQAISLANQLSCAITCPPENRLEFDNILKRISVIMKIEVRFLKERIEQTRELAIELLSSYGASVLEHHIKALPKADDFTHSTANSVMLEMSKEKALLTALKQLTKLCRSSKNINELLTLTLQQSATIWGFKRCTFWILTANHQQVESRTTYNETGHAETFHHILHLNGRANLVSHVVEMDNAICVNGCQEKKWINYITPDLEKLIGSGAICFIPVKIDEKMVGIISGQRFNQTENISSDDFSQFSFLIEHLNMCLSMISHR
ncbi:HDOD domain-containing protein [Psychromonas hadalis]|uniref:HDOD domain-containing protein n=1 Tax=Psychromonas hadalis TaxID=211669 RepID=UPI0003B756BE|nr:HDOD domain-containing protein [Psychromonas hadalis]